MQYTKPPLSHEQQAQLIEARGMLVPDRPALLRALEVVGYYRLCAYWHPFKQPDESFAPGTSFATVWQRYVFDRQLRLIAIDAIERIEVAVRTALVHEIAMRYGAFGHTDRNNFRRAGYAEHARFLDELHREASRSREVFLKHFEATYDEFPNLPIWAAAETMSYGTMFSLYKMTEQRIQDRLTRRLGLNGPVLKSWLGMLLYIRNLCAHHSRLWNRVLAIKPYLPDIRHDARWYGPRAVSNDRVFVLLTVLQQLLNKVAPQTGWRDRLYALFDRFPSIPIADMGMPVDWRTHPLWQ